MRVTRPPSWFSGALASTPHVDQAIVDETPINYLRWGDPALPALLLLHGGAAHAHWWSFIGPQLTHRYHVIAPDLSGHGDSGHRNEYSMEHWGDEIMAVAAHAGVTDPPIVIGHSMGGHVAIAMAARFGAQLSGAIIIDSPVWKPDPESEEGEKGRMFRNPKTYPDLETALEHFHLMPPQPCENAWAVDHIARNSLVETEAGWTWKFDRNVFVRPPYESNDYLQRAGCRIALMHGQLSDLVTPDVQEYMEELTGGSAPMIEIPQAYHHVLLDQPLALVAAIRALLADWQHSVEKKRLRDLADQ